MEPVLGVRKVGIVFALPQESRGLHGVMAESRVQPGLADGLEFVQLGGLEVVIATSGVGRERCRQAVRKLIREGTEWVISAGFAAGLDPTVRVGDILISDRVTLMAGPEAEPIVCSREIVSALPPRNAFGFPIRMCETVTADRLILTALEKNVVHRQTGATGLDMETHAAAEICRECETPFLAVRSVSDAAGQDVPDIIADLVDMQGRMRKAYACAMRPSQWLSLWRLGKQAAVASANLGDLLGLLLLRLVRTTQSPG